MAKRHLTLRVEESTLEAVEAWAEERGTSRAQAVEALLTAALGTSGTDGGSREEDALRQLDALRAEAEAWHEQRSMLGDNIRDLRATVSTLTAQLAEKDRQMARLQDTVEHSQILEAAHVAGTLRGGTDVAQDVAQPRGIWAWLARKIEGK